MVCSFVGGDGQQGKKGCHQVGDLATLHAELAEPERREQQTAQRFPLEQGLTLRSQISGLCRQCGELWVARSFSRGDLVT